MLVNYFLLAFRNLKKQRGYAIINTAGLAVGLASALMVVLYVRHELTYDNYHPFAENTYRLGYIINFPNGEKEAAPYAPAGWDNYIKETYPDVSAITSFVNVGMPTSIHFEPKDKILLSEEIIWVEPNFTDVIHLDMLKGPAKEPLREMNSILLCESIAYSFFGEDDPIGKTLHVEHYDMTRGKKIPVVVSGVYRDIPSNSHIRPKYIANILSAKEVFPELPDLLNTSMADSETMNYWTQSLFVCNDEKNLPVILNDLQTRANELLKRFNLDFKFTPLIQKITNVHFDQEINWSIQHKSVDKKYMYVFLSIAALILIVACINYINLATAKSVARAKEIGLRKTFGGFRWQLFFQFMTESFVMVLLASVLALLLVLLFIPQFNNITGKTFSHHEVLSPAMMMIVAIVVVMVTIMAGSYPAVFVSGFEPANVLKGKFAFRKGSNMFRQFLTAIQFIVAVTLLSGSVIVVRQMDLMKSSKLNEAGKQIVSIRYGGFTSPATDQHYLTFKNKLLQDPEIDAVTLANHLPRLDFFGPINMRMEFPEVTEEKFEWFQLNGDYDFPKTFNLRIISGRDFDHSNIGDTTAVLLNEAAVKALKLTPDEVVGKTIVRPEYQMYYGPPDSTRAPITGHVIGVIEDFPYRSVHMKIEPLAICPKPHAFDRIIHVKLPPGKTGQKIASIEKTWKEVFPNFGFDYWFIDDEFGRMYENETQVTQLVEKFSALAILITCVGLYGLASFISEQRTKEIGIRKTLGASNLQILGLLLNVFAKLLLIACVVGIPIAYYLSSQWLSSFVYQTSLSFLVFAAAIGVIAFITLVTVGYESLKASMANPVKALKHE